MTETTAPRILRPGEDYSLWPNMKWARARQLASELLHSVSLQSASSRAGLDVDISEDKLSATFSVREAAPKPIHEWSLLFADVIHNYRAALDALAWEMAHLDGKRPRPQDEARIYFPICTSKTQWEKQAKGPLASVPHYILRRLFAVQPFHAEPVEQGVLVSLHRLDIADKHKGQVKASVLVRQGATTYTSFRLEEGYTNTVHESRPAEEWLTDGSPVRKGQPVFRINTGSPIAWAESHMPLPLKLAVELGGREIEIFPLIDTIEKQFGSVFQVINTGSLPDQPGLVVDDFPY
ncbi:hypothetical protein [Leucobacter chromiireducens]|uniref:hypothetical protein n=1 Tax=Leucobacter chromiireducens TaxID=283877 RepID=UPI001925C9CB|nr:hypothetical protein [Leucobacter chromiireducens]